MVLSDIAPAVAGMLLDPVADEGALESLRADAAGRETSRHVATASDARPATAVHADEVIGVLPTDMRVAGVGDEIVDRLADVAVGLSPGLAGLADHHAGQFVAAVNVVQKTTDGDLRAVYEYRKGRFEVAIETAELAKEIDKLGGIGRQVVIAVILVGMLIGSAIAASVVAFIDAQDDELWELILRLAYFGYVFSMVIAAIIVIKLVWDWLRGKKAV